MVSHYKLADVAEQTGHEDESFQHRLACKLVMVGMREAGMYLDRPLEALLNQLEDSDNPRRRGEQLMRRGRMEEAIANFDEVIATDPKDVAAWINRSHALAALGRFDDALASSEKALAADPDSASACNNRAVFLNRLGRLDEALKWARRAAELNSQEPEIWDTLAEIQAASGDTGAARESYRRALALLPNGSERYDQIHRAQQALVK